MGIPFVGKTVLGVVVAVIGSEDDEGVVEDSLSFEFSENFAADGVDLGGEAIVVLHHALEFFRRIEAPVPAVAAFILFIKKFGEVLPGFLGGIRRDGDGDVLIELFTLWLGEKFDRDWSLGHGGRRRQR